VERVSCVVRVESKSRRRFMRSVHEVGEWRKIGVEADIDIGVVGLDRGGSARLRTKTTLE